MEMVEYFKDGKVKRKKFASTAQGKLEGEKFAAEKRNEGMRVKETKKERLKRHQDYDQKAIDADKKPVKVKIIKDEVEFKKKITVGGDGPNLYTPQVRGY
jgi:hypothetical protein